MLLLVKTLTNIDFDLNYHPVSENFPQNVPDQCVVMAGDSFASISERMYGDRSFANLIADANGYREGDRPPVGLLLQVPSTPNTNIHNWEGIYPLYNPAAIIGSLYPNMPIPQRHMVMAPQRRHRHHFWHVFVEAVIGTAIMAFAPGLAASFAGVLG